MSLPRELAALLGAEAVIDGGEPAARAYLSDATESRAIRGRAEAVALPGTGAQVASVLGWCYEHDTPLTPRGGGTGYAGGAVPEGGVVVSLERLRGAVQIDPGQWRARVPSGTITADLRLRARQTGLFFPPDPGAADRSMIGGNLATNAGGPHSFKYGVTGAWVTGMEVALAPGRLSSVGGPFRKDVAGYDLRSLMIGSEGTLGIITSAWVRLIPAPALELPVLGLYPDAGSGCQAVAATLAAGLVPATLEYLDGGALSARAEPLVRALPELDPAVVGRAGFLVLAEADGASEQSAARLRDELRDAMAQGALQLAAPQDRREIRQLWEWRAGVSSAVIAQRGGKLSEDIVVPLDRLPEALQAVDEIGARHQLAACSWGHAGDGNLHATFMIDSQQASEVRRAEAASQELFDLAVRLGGSVSGEHGIGLVKRGALARQWEPAAVALHEQLKRLFDPKGLINPGKKLAR